MASPANCNYSPALGIRFDAYFCLLGQGLGARDLSGARLSLAVALDRLPDAALRQMGIARADIPRIVFRDLFTL
ncbi:hypothetical protein N8I71_18000 [Roseibacterium sp. SDUM158016]|uniref:hypothetical protein n=1 Tax=Roseicyclus sediminis TaxID=2980997 RepID=UPI0021D16D6C|nr:hypothetical protein [Roseibacterium sp. SDUM158016]MCU4654735.1 hypothetical protein [Roseibacterium sp. SDUM158016]